VTVNEMTNATTADDSAEQLDTAEDTGATSKPGAAARARAGITRRWKGIALTALLLTSAVVSSVLYFTEFRPGRQTDPAAQTTVIDAASAATVALLSYSPETLDRDMERAQSLMAGDFLTYYGKFTAEVVAPAVRERGIKANAQVLNSALMEMQPGSAKVLIFLNQETVSRDRPEPALTASSVVVTLVKTDGHWRISALDPV
jgi:Mce-associated membrane protein